MSQGTQPKSSSTPEIKGDLTVPINELRSIYNKLRAYYEGRAPNSYFVKNKPLRPVVIGISPQMPRRKEQGWFQPAQWESEGEKVFSALTKQKGVQVYDEIFIVGDSLNAQPIEIVRNMAHQLAHQIATNVHTTMVANNRTYHNSYFEWGFKQMGIWPTYDKSSGWATVDWASQGQAVTAVLQKIADEIDPMAFDTFRTPTPERVVQPTRMKKWQCKSCLTPRVVRCTGLLLASCNRCGDRFVYADKDRHTSDAVRHWVNYSNIEVLP